jgi:4-hydroxybenzoyl-CoA reductase subunit beta
MMRCPPFRYEAPASVEGVAKLLAEHGKRAMLLAGGTDLLPNLKRRQHAPEVVVALRRVEELRRVAPASGWLDLGAGLTLTATAHHPALGRAYRALTLAAGKVATPHIQNVATLGGNLCLDTRCNYYDQSWEWRQAIGFCKKAPDGTAKTEVAHGTCWVAPGSPRCWAVSSTDSAPALTALGAEVTLVSAQDRRRIKVPDLYKNDGMDYLARRPDEVLTTVHVPLMDAAWRSTYWKLRRRGSFDFPVASVAAAARFNASGEVAECRVALGSVASCPLLVPTDGLVGRTLTDDAIGAFAEIASKPARPLDNTDFHLSWRKRVVKELVTGALRELRGDDAKQLGLLARNAVRVLPLA